MRTNLDLRGLHDLSESVHKRAPRILLVDDEPLIVEHIEQILTANGYEVRSTCRAKDAIEIARSFQPQVAILGVVMPEVDGIKLGMQFSEFLPQAKIVLVHPDVLSEADLERLRGCGYQFDTFPLPFKKEDFLEKIKLWICDASYFDSATGFGLASHFAFMIDTEIWRSERHDSEFSVVFFDIRDFWRRRSMDASSNDKRNLLGKISQRVKSMCRLVDFGFRYGENRFALLLPQEPKNFANQVAHKLLQMFEETDWEQVTGSPVRLHAAVAVVSFPEDGRTREELLAQAERLMSTANQLS